ncbi:hypothetical protein Vadar_012461 [Vaccinium darrowii]|uniref:Uncharacterized protein n=1 Tax=Vaccinium darrowii TaxID=229202 RepID=A0ACB7XQ51_9ERIC|nr:hypothetical protein Vadar_012461 [Vaccinium darrowii]
MAAPSPLLERDAVTHMDDDLASRFKSFTLTNEEKGKIMLSQEDVVESMAECRTSLLGKVISQKPPNLVGLRSTMEKVWGNPKNFRVLAIGDSIFQFIFPTELEASRVLRGKTWFFNNHFLNLERWQPHKAIKDYSFAYTPMWIQAWGLPLQFLSKDVGVKLGLRFGDVDEVVIPQFGSRDGRYIRIRTVLDVTQPLKRGCMIKFPNKNPVWVEFRYEKLPTFCRYCGKVGHEFLGCDKRFLDMEDEVFRSTEYGLWLRASPATQQGRRHEGVAPAGRSKAEESNSVSGESLADNQGSKSWDVNAISNLNQNGNEDISNSNPSDRPRDSAHEEMVTEAYFAERYVQVNPHSNPELQENQLTPYLEQILQKFSRPVPAHSIQPEPAQSPSKSNTPPISTTPIDPPKPCSTTIPAQPIPHLVGPCHKQSPQTCSTFLPQPSSIAPPLINMALSPLAPDNSTPAHTQPNISSSPSLIISNSPPTFIPINPPLINPHTSTNITTDLSAFTLIDIHVATAPFARKSRIKHPSGVFAFTRKHRQALGPICGNQIRNPNPSPTPKFDLNPNGKRNLENLNPNLNGAAITQLGPISTTHKRARVSNGVASVGKNVVAATVEEASPKWSPTAQ